MIKTVLITGARGQLGCELIRLSGKYPTFHFIATDRRTLDVTRKEEIIRFLKKKSIDFIIHCAAYTQVDKAEEEKSLCYDVNCGAIKNLIEAANGKTKILYVSTDYVFDGEKRSPYTENCQTEPLSVYGKSKRDGEVILARECSQSVIVRTSWLYSSFGNSFNKIISSLLKEQKN